MRFCADETIDAVMRKRPSTISVLIKYKMACVGCAIAPFHTVKEVSAEYGTNCDELLHELDAVFDVVK